MERVTHLERWMERLQAHQRAFEPYMATLTEQRATGDLNPAEYAAALTELRIWAQHDRALIKDELADALDVGSRTSS